TLSCAPCAASARKTRVRLALPAAKVCLKLIWPLTYSERPARRSTSPNSWTASTPPLASPSIAKASSLPSLKRSPARTFPAHREEYLRPPSGDPMTLLAAFLEIAAGWRDVFPQSRTFQRAVRQALGSLVCLGRRGLSRIIWTNGGQHRSWGAEYFLHSRCEWQPQELFRPILQRALAYCPGRLVGVAVDDTRLPKTGRCIQQAFYQRDPLSPHFHVNLMLGLRFLQASLL